MLKFGIAALIAAVILGWATYNEITLASHCSDEPEKISLKDLIARGPEGNAHVAVTNFVLCDNFVHQFGEKQKDHWTHVWVPIVPVEELPAGEKKPLAPNNVKALLYSRDVPNAAHLQGRLGRSKVQGLVTNRISSLDTEVRDLLRQNYPGTDFETCLIIQAGRTPASRAMMYWMGAGAAVLLLLGAGLVTVGLRRS